MVKLDEFQTLYILTCQMVYGKIRLLGKAPEDAQKFLADFYVKVYEGSGFIPAEEERQESWAEEHICDMLDDEEREKALEIFRLKTSPQSRKSRQRSRFWRTFPRIRFPRKRSRPCGWKLRNASQTIPPDSRRRLRTAGFTVCLRS